VRYRVRLPLQNPHDQFGGGIILQDKIKRGHTGIDFSDRQRLQHLATRCLSLSMFGGRGLSAVAMHCCHRRFRCDEGAERTVIRDQEPRRHQHDDENEPAPRSHSTNHGFYLISPIVLMFKHFIKCGRNRWLRWISVSNDHESESLRKYLDDSVCTTNRSGAPETPPQKATRPRR